MKKEWIFAIFFKITPVNRVRRFKPLDVGLLDNNNNNSKQSLLTLSAWNTFIDHGLLIVYRLMVALYLSHPLVLIYLVCTIRDPFESEILPLVCISFKF